MKINNKLIIYKTRLAYEEAYRSEKIKDDSIVFVIQDHTIHTHGETFGDGVEHQKGFFGSVDTLPADAASGDWAVVNEGDKWYVYFYHKSTGWSKGTEYQMPNLTTDILNQYIRKTNIRDYLKDIYNNVYVRKDEVYSPDQEWPTEYDGDNWRWDDEGNLYLIDKELSLESDNAVENKVVTAALNTKVDINNYRYDKQDISNKLDHLTNTLNTLIGDDDATAAIDTFREIVDFLNNIDNTTLISLLANKQDVISDIDDIRQGSIKGATAYQLPADGIPKSDLSSDVQNSLNLADTALQQHLSLDNYYTKDEIDTKDQLIEDDLTQHIQDEVRHVTKEDKDAWNGKYDKPESGIPELDLSDNVLYSLGLARTSLQEHQSLSGYATEQWVLDLNFLSAIEDLEDIRSKANTALLEHLSLNGYATEQWVENKNYQPFISDLSDIRSGASAGAIAYQKPNDGIAYSDLSSQIKNSLDLADSSIQSLANYYTKGEVNGLLDAINQFDYVVATTLPAPSEDTLYKIYLIPNTGSEQLNVKDEYITVKSGDVYTWELFGTTQISLANYYNKQETDSLLDLKQDTSASYTPLQGDLPSSDEIDDPGYDPHSDIVPTVPTDAYATWNRVLDYIDSLPKMRVISIDTYELMEDFDDNTSYWIYE